MAKKATTKKAATKKSAKKSAKKAATKKSATRKPARKAATKKSTKKAATKKSSKKAATKKSAKKAATKKPTKKAATKKAATKKTATKKAATKKAATKKAATKKAVAGKKAAGKKTSVKRAMATKVAPAMPGSPIKPPVVRKKKNDRRVAPTVVPSRRKLQKKAEAEAAAKTPRRKIDFANPRSVVAAAASSEADKNGFVYINGRRVRAISTKGAGTKKKRATKVVEVEPEVAPKKDVSKIKTKLSKADLTKYKDLLILRRREIMGMVSGLETEALRSSGGNLSNMPVHMADVGTDVFEQDFTLGMAATEREMVVQIDAALTRIENRTYGVCQATGKPIPKTRLNAKPWAKYTVEAARAAERGLPLD
ncbi:MAG: TraR/DksA C4-type zinc finger protein [Planctomycetota bacterium]|nr:TraR/DksA C4-type zinc finger protein [Planctomycetota bacterium]